MIDPDSPIVSSLSVVLPAYNEQENIAGAVGHALEVLPRLARKWEVIVVDDGSTDRTADVVEDLMLEHHPRVRLLRHDVNKGYGAALRTGFSRARHDFVFYTDADNQFDVADLAYSLPMMKEHDVVVGFRVYRYDTPLRVIASWGYNLLIRALFRVRVRDVDCSFKVFRREVLDKITVETTNFFVDTELVAKARKWNFRLAEKGVRHYPRTAGETTVQPSDVLRTLRTVLQMWQRIHLPTRRQVDEAARIRAAVTSADVEQVPATSRRDAGRSLLPYSRGG
jgi:glycosyltransferase involved in cell wall biosynthesis